jgi:hypothetical protein
VTDTVDKVARPIGWRQSVEIDSSERVLKEFVSMIIGI